MAAINATVFSFNTHKFLLFLFLSSFSITGNAGTVPYSKCSNATFSPNSTFLPNLNLVFSSLSSNASHHLYYNTSISSKPTAYGDFQCRGDINASTCKSCVSMATSNSSQQFCPLSFSAVIWFDECLLRYSNNSFFSIVAKQPRLVLINPEEIKEDFDRFNQLLNSTLVGAAAQAAGSSSEKTLLFGTQEVEFRNETIYTMAQCTGDLSRSDCGECLLDAVNNIPMGKKGARVLLPSCTLRYELYAFYDGVKPSSPVPAPVQAPAPVPPVPSSSGSSPAPSAAAPPLSGKDRSKMAMAMAMVISITATLLS